MADGPVDWHIAERVAVRAAGREPFADSYLAHSLQADFDDATAEAEELVAQATGLRSLSGPARARVTDREGWVHANVASFQRLLQPITAKFGETTSNGLVSVMARKVAGAEVGMLLGWMSGRVLGQYDLLVVEDPDVASPEDQDLVYYVGPNVLALEKRFAFPPKEFRLWLALHEVTHRAQFTGVPWMREHYLGLVSQTMDSLDPDPKRFVDALTKVVTDLREGRKPLDDGGIAMLLASPEQRLVLDKIGGLMSLLEGHGDVTMDRAGADRIASAPRFARVLRERRANANPVAKLLQRLLGLEAKMNQYAQGENFIAEVERLGGGPDALEPVWRGASWLPTLAEIRDPEEWLDRVRLSDELVGWPSTLAAVASVLVVDDRADVVASLRLALEGRGHAVSVARSGAAALVAVRKQAPDLVVVAAAMAKLDGWAALRQLKEDADASVRAVPVVLLAPMDAVDDELRAGIEGAVACVDEPVDPSTLLAAVQAVLGGGAEADQRKAAQHRALTRLAQLEAGAGRVAAPTVRLIDLEGPRHRQGIDLRVAAPGSRPTLNRDLTPRQRDILRAIAGSVTVTEAAADLGVSRSSLYGGLRRIGRTLGVPDVRSLIRRVRAGDLAASFER